LNAEHLLTELLDENEELLQEIGKYGEQQVDQFITLIKKKGKDLV
jgi:hypothetical protein